MDEGSRAMANKFRIEVEDVEGHTVRGKIEDMTGQPVTIRMEDGAEVQGHYKYREDMTGDDDVAGHSRLIDLEVDDTQANMLAAANERGEPIYVRFPDGAEVTGHGTRWGFYEDATGEDAEGHGTRFYI